MEVVKIVRKNGEIELEGFEYKNLKILKENEKAILVHRKGGIEFVSKGHWEYHHPEFIVFKKLSENEVSWPEHFVIEYNRETKKGAFNLALSKFNELI
jgi:hypothetical protein